MSVEPRISRNESFNCNVVICLFFVQCPYGSGGATLRHLAARCISPGQTVGRLAVSTRCPLRPPLGTVSRTVMRIVVIAKSCVGRMPPLVAGPDADTVVETKSGRT